MLTAEQRAVRVRGIGGSEVAAVLGLHPYRTPLDIFLAKTGRGDEKSSDTVAARMGHRLEPVVADLYLDERPWLTLSASDTLWHPSDLIALATPDRFVAAADGARWLLEIKTTNWRLAHLWGEPGTDRVPDHVALQAHWQLYVTGLTRCDVAALIDGRDFRAYTLTRDDELIDEIATLVREWWDRHVVPDLPPEPTAADNTAKLARLFKQLSPDMVERPELAPLAEELNHHRVQIAEHEAAKERLEALFKTEIGALAGVTGPWGKCMWKKSKDGIRTNWEALAESLLPTKAGERQKLIDEHATPTTGSRRFLFTYAGREA